MQKNQSVDDDGAELNDKDPDVVECKTFALVVLRGPAPGASSNKVLFPIHEGPERCEEQREEPGETDQDCKDSMTNPLTLHGTDESVGCNEEDEQTGGYITNVDQPSLSEAGATRSEDGVYVDPVPRDKEGHALLKIGKEEVHDQDDILVLWRY